MKSVLRDSFTLVELLIVLLLISLLYGIFIQRLGFQSKKKISLTPLELPSLVENNDSLEIICTNECQKCALYEKNKKIKDIDLFQNEVKVFDIDPSGNSVTKKFLPLFDTTHNPIPVCFRYKSYPNRTADSFILSYQDKFYIFFPYLYPPKEVSSLEEAVEIYTAKKWLPLQSDEYY